MPTTIWLVSDRRTGEPLGSVFWDEEWEAYGYDATAAGFFAGANGPCDTKEEALEDLLFRAARERSQALVEEAP